MRYRLYSTNKHCDYMCLKKKKEKKEKKRKKEEEAF